MPIDLFRDSDDLDVLFKILNWGPENVGKTHFMLSWSQVANGIGVLDFENRASQLKDRFKFKHAVPTSIQHAIAMLEYIALGKMDVATIGVDSLTKPYLAYVKMFTETKTSQAGNQYQATDWAAVNRAMLTQFIEPLFAIKGKHIICSARQTSDLKRDKGSKDFTNLGIKINGDGVRWRYDYDYVLHWVTRGLVKVEKSMSPNLPVESEIYGDLDAARFIRLVRGEEDVRQVKRGHTAAAHRAAPQTQTAPPVNAEVSPIALNSGDTVAPLEMVGLGLAPSADLDSLLMNIEAGPTRTIFALAKAKQIDDNALAERIFSFTNGKPLSPDLYADFVASLKAA